MPKAVAAIVFLLITGGWAAALVRNYNPATQTASLPLLGTSLQLGDNERGEGGGGEHRRHDDDDD